MGKEKKNTQKKTPLHLLSALSDACFMKASGESTCVFANLLF